MTRRRRPGPPLVELAQVGNGWINAFGIPDMTTPWGGRARSGRGLGAAGIESFTEDKTVLMMF